MMKIKSGMRRIAGKRAKYAGSNFERSFENLCWIQKVACVRIPDGCRQVGAFKLIRVYTPFDYVIGYGGRAAFIDTKSVASGNFTHSMVKPHQVKSLGELAPCGLAGYVIGFNDSVWFVDVALLSSLKPGESVDLDKARYLGGRLSFDVRLIFDY